MAAVSDPRWFTRAPSDGEAEAFLREVGGEGVSYRETGATRSDAERPAGYTVDHNRQRIGEGEADFMAGCEALRGWRMFPQPWTRIHPQNAPLREGQVVAMMAKGLGLWWLNACRIVYTLDERGPVRRFGFAYGTLLAHVEQGEERFSVELQADGSVWYDVRAFSRPRYWPVRLGKPLARRLQRRFVEESKAAMRTAVAAARASRRVEVAT
ncbi:MAG: DUF1990 domain-containing protein [Verrucomicrobiota bacterium]